MARWARLFGIDPEVIFAHPPGDVCDLCQQEVSGDRWDVLNMDHDHETGKFRGWLCGPCNRALGLFRDDPELLRRAVNYLENSRLGS